MEKTHEINHSIDMQPELQFDLALDLLPLYIDGKTCPDSNAFVETMLSTNEELSRIYQRMIQDLTMEPASTDLKASSVNTDKDKRHKFVRHPYLKTPIIIIIILVTYALLMMGLVAWMFIMHTAML
ncbi:MAG: hypothetical protein IJ648_06490 [Lachnospiraceae bacterium]|nr:hypothetical protein [Lachnospiraceae bacterium]